MASVGPGTSGARVKSGSNKRPGQELDRTAAQANLAGCNPCEDGQGPTPVALKFVVQQAVKRWFEDTYQEAVRGDVKQQALLGQMYAEGYGCEKDPKAAKEWMDKAGSRGYRMQGVYCEL